MRMRFILLTVALSGVALTVSSCGVSGEAARSEPPWRREYSDEEWLAMVTRCEHQPRVLWKGTTSAHIGENSWGAGLQGLLFNNTPANLLDYQLAEGLLWRRPRLFLPLFESEDASVVLTGIYAYTHGRYFDREDAALIRAALRGALNHVDTRVRCAALETLYRKGWLGVDDARRGLMDRALIIRNLTALFLSNVVQNELAERAGPAGVRRPAWTAQQRLAPILLDHLNDNYFYVRVTCAHRFLNMFPESDRPPKFDWVKADWDSRVAMQAEWKAWWEGHGRGALVAAAQ